MEYPSCRHFQLHLSFKSVTHPLCDFYILKKDLLTSLTRCYFLHLSIPLGFYLFPHHYVSSVLRGSRCKHLCCSCYFYAEEKYTILNKIIKKKIEPWLVWLSGLSADLQTKGSPFRFPVRPPHAWVAGQVLSRGRVRGNHTLMFPLPLFLLPFPSLEK